MNVNQQFNQIFSPHNSLQGNNSMNLYDIYCVFCHAHPDGEFDENTVAKTTAMSMEDSQEMIEYALGRGLIKHSPNENSGMFVYEDGM